MHVQDGSVWGWGNSHNGRLCCPADTESLVPMPLPGFQRHVVLQVAAGTTHSLACTTAGVVLAWGRDSHGQLGIGGGSGNTVTTPRRVEGQLRRRFVRAIAAGHNHSGAITSGGDVYGWGDNRHGQLGIGTPAGSQYSSPIAVPLFGRKRSGSDAEQKGFATTTSGSDHSGGRAVDRIAAGGNATAVIVGGRVFEWGDGKTTPGRVRIQHGVASRGASSTTVDTAGRTTLKQSKSSPGATSRCVLGCVWRVYESRALGALWRRHEHCGRTTVQAARW